MQGRTPNIDTYPGQIKDIRNRDIGMPKIIDINLAITTVDQEYSFAGNVFYVWSTPDATSYVNIKVNSTDQPAIPFLQMQGLKTPFDKLYITTPAGQAGTLKLLLATEAPELLTIIDNRSATVTGLSAILAELQGITAAGAFIGVTVGVAAVQIFAANATRKACLIQALSTNTGIIYLGFANTVTAGGAPGIWFAELQAGMSFAVDDYRGPIWAIATAAAQVVGSGEW